MEYRELFLVCGFLLGFEINYSRRKKLQIDSKYAMHECLSTCSKGKWSTNNVLRKMMRFLKKIGCHNLEIGNIDMVNYQLDFGPFHM